MNIGTKSHINCRTKSIEIYTDSLCTTAYTGSVLTPGNNPLQISVDTSNPIGVTPLSVFIKETTFGLVSACGEIEFEICGNEEITISGTIEKTYIQGSGV
jgi:hypothetical protein